MPSVTQASQAVPSSPKKRRRDDNNHEVPLYAGLVAETSSPRVDIRLHGTSNPPRAALTDKDFSRGSLLQHHVPQLATRKIIPFPSSKRRRTSTEPFDAVAEGEQVPRSPTSSPLRPSRELQQIRGASRADSAEEARAVVSVAGPLPNPAALMRRCHICSRKPNKTSDLDSFADCQGCGQRTCYVCIRECLGWGPNTQTAELDRIDQYPPAAPREAATTAPEEEGDTSFTMLDADIDNPSHAAPPPTEAGQIRRGSEPGWTKGGGHRQMVCSRCCVEKGQDGDVVCLGCLPFVEG